MKCRTVPRLFRLAVLFLAPGVAATVPAATKPATPNIVLILADDLGYGSLSCYGADTNLVRTPNCDRLAREGVRFTDANTTSSVCSPTRYALMTGRYAWRTSLQYGVLAATAPLHIETNRLTMASLLKRHGYRAAAIGKWHLGYGLPPRADFTADLRPGPLELGFDYHFGVPCNHGDLTGVFVEGHRVAGLRSTNRLTAITNLYGNRFLGLDAPQRRDEDVMPTLTDKAVAWLQKQEAGKPFFLYYTPVAVHEPVTPSTRTAGSSKAGPYGDWIHDLDLSVGRVLDALDKKGLAKDTLVLFTSDNGGENKPTRGGGTQVQAQAAGLKINGDFRAGKHSIFQGGFRVPFIVRWPGKAPAGTVCSQPISLVNMLATMAAIVDDNLPPPAVGAEDSLNVLPTFLGKKISKPLHPNIIVHSVNGVFAIRQGPWKYIEGKAARKTENSVLRGRPDEASPLLYNLAEDPTEQNDLAARHPEIVQRLAKLLDQRRNEGRSRP